jgi:hypothetical protein
MSLAPAHHHVDLAASTPRADELLAPFEDVDIGAVATCMLDGIRLHLRFHPRRRLRGRHRLAGLRHRALQLLPRGRVSSS